MSAQRSEIQRKGTNTALLTVGGLTLIGGLFIPVIIFSVSGILGSAALSIGSSTSALGVLIGGGIATGGVLPFVIAGAAILAMAGAGLYHGMKYVHSRSNHPHGTTQPAAVPGSQAGLLRRLLAKKVIKREPAALIVQETSQHCASQKQPQGKGCFNFQRGIFKSATCEPLAASAQQSPSFLQV